MEGDTSRTSNTIDTTDAMMTIALTYLILALLLSLIAAIFNGVIITAICKFKEMFIKRNYFILNICVVEFISNLLAILTVIIALCFNTHVAFYILIIEVGLLLGTVKFTLLLCFMINFIYNKLTDRKKLLYALLSCWLTVPIIVLVLGAIASIGGLHYITAFISITSYAAYALIVLVIISYIVISFIYCKSERTNDIKIRYLIISIYVIALICAEILTIAFGLSVGSTFTAFADGLKMLAIVIILLNCDANFKRALKGICSGPNDANEYIRYDSLEHINV